MSAAAEEAVTALRQAEQPLTVAHLDRALRTLSAGVAAQDGEPATHHGRATRRRPS